MTERERLIELVDKAKEEYSNDVTDHTETDYIVECLLDNGVIVPPCKVGDILYLPIEHRIIAYEVSKIKYDGDLLKIVTHNKLSGSQRTIWEMDVGSTIFLTREEAKKALKVSKTKKG